MDPATLTLISILGPAFWKVFETLLDKGKDQLLDQGFAPFKALLERGYQAHEQDDKLRAAILASFDDLKKDEALGPFDVLFATNRLTGLDQKTRLGLAAAAVEMTHLTTSLLPADLLQALDVDGGRADLLARFLFALRKHLAPMDGFKEGIGYADVLDGKGLLRGIASDMTDVSEKMEALATMEQALLADRRLATEDKQALLDYLAEMCRKWEGLMLPLLRKKSGDVTSAKLKQVFVPLRLRDVQADEQARKKQKPGRMPDVEMAETKPVEIGELLNRHARFILVGPPGCGKTTLLNRLALAFAEGRAASELGWQGGALLPLFLRLRNFGAFLQQNREKFPEPCSGSLVAYLENLLRDGERIRLTADFFDKRLAEGNCLVLMDGLDEVAGLRSEVAGHIDAFVARYSKGNRFGMASRPRGYETVELQLRRSNLAVAGVNPLDLRGIRQLVENLLALIEPDPDLRAADLDNLTRAISASAELTEIAGTPLFCAALVQVYKYHGARLPNRRVDVFDEIVDLLLGYWQAQKVHLSQAEQLALEDGTGRTYREVKDAVVAKQRRLSYLAESMQRAGQAEISKEEAAAILCEYLKQRERVPDEATAQIWAEAFLLSSHELSGLLVERDLGVYSFLHKGFMEYLAASALVNQSKTLVETLLEHLDDESWWEQVILLAGAHPKLSEDIRVELLNAVLERAASLPPGSDEQLRCLVMAGRLGRDMGEYLPGPDHARLEQILLENALNAAQRPLFRAAAADALDELGYQPADLYNFVPIPNAQQPQFLIGKYPVTNAQYQRFLRPDNFGNAELWRGFPKFDENFRPLKEDWGDKGWDWLQAELEDEDNPVENGVLLPRTWREPRFGCTRPGAPVVGVSWYEACAYCRWLLVHWDGLAEGKQGLARPALARLPLESEWAQAAGGDEDNERYAWDTGRATGEIEKIVQRANISESKIGRTTPVWQYPQGASPAGVMDLSGNVWEWQANYRNQEAGSLGLRGGS